MTAIQSQRQLEVLSKLFDFSTALYLVNAVIDLHEDTSNAKSLNLNKHIIMNCFENIL